MNLERAHRFLAFTAMIVLFMTGCAGTREGMGVYRFRGKVVDAETQAPIQKARIIFDRYGFYRNILTGHLPSDRFINEGLTNPQGDFQLDDHFPLRAAGSNPALHLLNLSSIPKPNREMLVIFSEGHEPAFFSFQSGWFSSDLIRLEFLEGNLREVERIGTGSQMEPTGYKFKFVRRKLKPEASQKPYSGYILDLPMVQLRRIQKSEPVLKTRVPEGGPTGNFSAGTSRVSHLDSPLSIPFH